MPICIHITIRRNLVNLPPHSGGVCGREFVIIRNMKKPAFPGSRPFRTSEGQQARMPDIGALRAKGAEGAKERKGKFETALGKLSSEDRSFLLEGKERDGWISSDSSKARKWLNLFDSVIRTASGKETVSPYDRRAHVDDFGKFASTVAEMHRWATEKIEAQRMGRESQDEGRAAWKKMVEAAFASSSAIETQIEVRTVDGSIYKGSLRGHHREKPRPGQQSGDYDEISLAPKDGKGASVTLAYKNIEAFRVIR